MGTYITSTGALRRVAINKQKEGEHEKKKETLSRSRARIAWTRLLPSSKAELCLLVS